VEEGPLGDLVPVDVAVDGVDGHNQGSGHVRVAGGGYVDVVGEAVSMVSHHGERSGDVDVVGGSRGGDDHCGGGHVGGGALVGTDGGGGAGLVRPRVGGEPG